MLVASTYVIALLALASGTHAAGPPAMQDDEDLPLAAPPTLEETESVPRPKGQIFPCIRGQGSDNGCGYCSNSSGMAVTDWKKAKFTSGFTLDGAEAKEGRGWDVYWNVPEVGEGCRVVLQIPSGHPSMVEGVLGTTVLSVSQPGCYFANVHDKVSASFCCGSGDCAKIGAQMSASKRDFERVRRTARGGWSGMDEPEPEKPKVTCSPAKPDGDVVFKSGRQQIDPDILNCSGGEFCSLSPSIATTTGTSYTNEESTTMTQSNGMSYSVTAGYGFPIGFQASATIGGNHEWSEALGNSLSATTDASVSKTMTFGVNVEPGSRYQAFFIPVMQCQRMKTKCNDADMVIEKCEPRGTDGNPDGETGVITIG